MSIPVNVIRTIDNQFIILARKNILFNFRPFIMKTSFILLSLFILPFGYLLGEIKNGYEAQLQSTRASLQKLNAQLLEDSNLSSFQRLRIKSEIRSLINIISCYQLTQELINQLKIVSPGMYDEMSNIKDKRERVTDVFIKLIPREQARIPLQAATFFGRSSIDEDTNLSEYGEYSVSVIIWIVDNSLLFLYHELGHIKYVVPNLATYSEFSKKCYHGARDLGYIGHNRHDQSGKIASAFEKRFFEDRATYVSMGREKLESTISIMQKITKNNRHLENAFPPEPSYAQGITNY